MAATDQIEQRKLELVQQIEEARTSVLGAKLLLDEQIAEKKSSISETLNFPKRIKRAFQEQPAKSFGVALATGLTASFFMKRKSKHKELSRPAKRSLVTGVTLAVLKPILQRFAVQLSQQWLAHRAEQKFAQETHMQQR